VGGGGLGARGSPSLSVYISRFQISNYGYSGADFDQGKKKKNVTQGNPPRRGHSTRRGGSLEKNIPERPANREQGVISLGCTETRGTFFRSTAV